MTSPPCPETASGQRCREPLHRPTTRRKGFPPPGQPCPRRRPSGQWNGARTKRQQRPGRRRKGKRQRQECWRGSSALIAHDYTHGCQQITTERMAQTELFVETHPSSVSIGSQRHCHWWIHSRRHGHAEPPARDACVCATITATDDFGEVRAHAERAREQNPKPPHTTKAEGVPPLRFGRCGHFSLGSASLLTWGHDGAEP